MISIASRNSLKVNSSFILYVVRYMLYKLYNFAQGKISAVKYDCLALVVKRVDNKKVVGKNAWRAAL